MCGIVGFITAEKATSTERKRWFINALRAGVVRGDDGTGMFLVPHEHTGSADWAKIGSTPEDFLRSEPAQARLGSGKSFDDYRAVIGHNRSATIGSVSTNNAHPFQEGPITLVHNGTLNNTKNLPHDKALSKGVDVDSHLICHSLATHTVPEVVKQLDGAYVLVWHDARDQSVNIIRNDRRPLHLMALKYQNTVLMASEAEMLWWLVKRSNFTAGDVYYPEPGYHLKFMPDEGIKPRVVKLEQYRWTYAGSGYGGGGNYTGYPYDDEDRWTPERAHAWHQRTYGGRDGEGSNTGKDQRPMLGVPVIAQSALNRKLPKGLTKTLESVNLQRLDKLRMAVVSVLPVYGTPHAVVIGRLLDLPGVPTGQIYGLTYEAIKSSAHNETWTVAPSGVKVVGAGVRIVLCRMLARTVAQTETVPSSPSSQTSSQTSSTEEKAWRDMTPEERAAELDKEAYYDADGDVVSRLEWLRAVEDGCSECGHELEPEYADDMVWDMATKKPICPECRYRMEESGELAAAFEEDDLESIDEVSNG